LTSTSTSRSHIQNSLGLPPRQRKLPRLLCRSLGPFLHASLQQLQLKPTLFPQVDPLPAVGATQANRRHHPYCRNLEVSGLVLPCAMRSILAAVMVGGGEKEDVPLSGESKDEGKTLAWTSNKALQSGSAVDSWSDSQSDSDDDEESMVGGRHVRVQMTVHGGGDEENTTLQGVVGKTSKTKGVSSRIGWGSSQGMFGSGSGAMKVAVWESSRPTVVAYQVGPSSSR
jgi:hypothetical protein